MHVPIVQGFLQLLMHKNAAASVLKLISSSVNNRHCMMAFDQTADRTIEHILPQAGYIVLCDPLREAQLLGHMQRDAHLRYNMDT